MKVSMWYNNKDIRIEEAPTPKPGRKEILVKIISCGICGSDIVEWYRLPRAPLVQGHEIGGEIVEVGGSVKNFRPGDRVFVAPKVPCMECYYCKNEHYPVCSNIKDRMPGGFAEYVLVPESLVENGTYLLPNNVTCDQSTFIEPLACVVRGMRVVGMKPEKTVLVIGSGIAGLLHIKLARALGADKIIATDINDYRLPLYGLYSLWLNSVVHNLKKNDTTMTIAIGKGLGLLVDKQEIEGSGNFTGLSNDELAERILSGLKVDAGSKG